MHEGQQLDATLRNVQTPQEVQARKGFAALQGERAACRARTSEDLAARALRRRRVFASRQAVMDSYGSRPPFRSFHRDALAAYVNHGFADLPGRKTLF